MKSLWFNFANPNCHSPIPVLKIPLKFLSSKRTQLPSLHIIISQLCWQECTLYMTEKGDQPLISTSSRITIKLICESIRAPIVSATGISNYILDLSKIYKNSNSYFRKDEHTYHIKPFKAFGSRKESFLFWIITHDCLIFAGDRGRCSCFAMTFSIWKKKIIIVITLLKCMAQKLEGNISNKQQL